MLYSIIILFTSLLNVCTQQQTNFRSFVMIRKTSMYFRPLNTSIYNRGQVTSRSRLACATSCFESNYCQTLTLIIEQNLCLLFGDPLDEGILISNASAETVFLANRNPRKYRSSYLMKVDHLIVHSSSL